MGRFGERRVKQEMIELGYDLKEEKNKKIHLVVVCTEKKGSVKGSLQMAVHSVRTQALGTSPLSV